MPRKSMLIGLLVVLASLAIARIRVTGQEAPVSPHVHSSRRGARKLFIPKAREGWSFAVFGDRTGGPQSGLKVLEKAVEETNLLDPDLVMTVGDLVNGYNSPAQWEPQAREYKGIMDKLKAPWFPVAGNHDVYWRGKGPRPRHENEASYEKHFGPLWYWFPHKDAAFIVLFTDEGDPKTGRKGFSARRPARIQFSPQQLGWLARTLKKTSGFQHVLVFMHHPRWDLDRYAESNWSEVHQLLVKAGNVKGVFAGHIHRMRYDGARDGIEYFILGATGAKTWRNIPAVGHLHHFNFYTIRKGGLAAATIPVGNLMNPRLITKELVDDVEAILRVPPFVTINPIEVSLGGPTQGFSTLRFKNPYKRSLDFTVKAEARGPWRLFPDHQHFTVKPGAQFDASFGYKRLASDRSPSPPRVVVQLDYLAPDRRISLPERRQPFPIAAKSAGPPPLARPKRNGVLKLGGRGACVRVSSRALALPKGPFTIEGWVKTWKFSGSMPLFGKTENSGYGLFLRDGRPGSMFHTKNRYERLRCTKRLKPGLWHHLAYVFEGSEQRLYIDGVLAARGPSKGGLKDNDFDLFIGAEPNADGEPVDAMTASIDEIRVSTGARYSGKAFKPSREHLKSDPSTHLLLHFDTAFGPFIRDHSGHEAHGKLIGKARCELEER